VRDEHVKDAAQDVAEVVTQDLAEGVLGEHVRDEPVKDAAQDVTQDVTQDVVEDMSGAAEDGSVKVFIVARVIFQRPPRFPWATREGRAREGRGAGR